MSELLPDDWLLGPPDVSHIADNLWMGACPIGDAPPQFDHLVALWEEKDLPYRPRAYQTLTLARMVDCEFIPDAMLLGRLVTIVELLAALGPTLVHCQAGLNRSGLVMALVLMSRNIAAQDAIAHLRKKRHDSVLCNHHFERWLLTK